MARSGRRRVVRQAGRFRLLTDGRSLYAEGPTEYMRERGDAVLRQIERGENTVTRMAPPGSDPGTTVLVALQTDFAGWVGARELEILSGVPRCP